MDVNWYKNILDYKYAHPWYKYVFYWKKPQCVLCYEVLSDECMKPAELR